eukprot:4333408-Pyramimonas_sp.AAC.1
MHSGAKLETQRKSPPTHGQVETIPPFGREARLLPLLGVLRWRGGGVEPEASSSAVVSEERLENQSQEGRQYMLRMRTNRKRGGSIYSFERLSLGWGSIHRRGCK